MSKRPRNLSPPPGPLLHWGPKALGLLFLVAGASKMLDPWSFYAALPGYGIGGGLRSLVSAFAPPLEITLGIALLAGWGLRQVVPAAAVFLGVFIAAIGFGWARGSLQECGCFGALLKRSPRDAMLIDAVFLALAVLLMRAGRDRPGKLEGWHKAILVVLAVVALGVTVSMLKTGPSGLRAIAAVPANEELSRVDLGTGEHLLYLFHHECPHCAKMSPRVAAYAQDPDLPRVVGFTFNTTRSQIDAYRQRYQLRIPVQVMPPEMFTRITGEGGVPQLVYVRDGKIVRKWIGVLPEPPSLARALDNSRHPAG